MSTFYLTGLAFLLLTCALICTLIIWPGTARRHERGQTAEKTGPSRAEVQKQIASATEAFLAGLPWFTPEGELLRGKYLHLWIKIKCSYYAIAHDHRECALREFDLTSDVIPEMEIIVQDRSGNNVSHKFGRAYSTKSDGQKTPVWVPENRTAKHWFEGGQVFPGRKSPSPVHEYSSSEYLWGVSAKKLDDQYSAERERQKLVDPASLEIALAKYGWFISYEKPGIYRRWMRPKDFSSDTPSTIRTVLIPLDPSRGDYEEILTEAAHIVASLAASDPEREHQKWVQEGSDQYRSSLSWAEREAQKIRDIVLENDGQPSERIYRVVVSYEQGSWLARVLDLAGTQTWTRSLRDVDYAVREAIAVAENLPEGAEAVLTLTYEYRSDDSENSGGLLTSQKRAAAQARPGRHRAHDHVDPNQCSACTPDPDQV